MSLNVLLDLSLLGRTSTPRGVIRYAKALTRALASRRSSDEPLTVSAMLDVPFLGKPRITEDIPAALEELALLRRRGTGKPLSGRVQHALTHAAKAAGADLVHSLDPVASPRSSLSVPRVVTCHHVDSRVSAENWHGPDSGVRSDRHRFARADRVIAISRATAQDLITHYDVPRGKITVVHNGVDLKRWSAEPSPDDSSRIAALGAGGHPYVVCVGGVDARKNVEGVLRGLAKARKLSGRQDLRIVWVGRLSRREQVTLSARAHAAGVADAVIRAGFVKDGDLAALYRGATALAFVSRREGFGFPVVEAMACACPVITSNRSSMVEIAEDSAITVDPEDNLAIADAIVLLADQNSERQRLGEKGQRRAERFGLAPMVDGTLGAYRRARELNA